jgi:uncharacterized membrane protein HdeD (DUF308 family)
MRESGIENVIERRRHLFENRFRGNSDWLRLLFLGGILIALSTVALIDALAVQHLPGHLSGSSAIFGGIAVILFVTRIARGALYFDWLLAGVSCLLAGLFLSRDENFTHTSSLLYVFSLMFASGAVRIWIGLTASPEEGASWILCSGLVAMLCGFWITLAWFFVMSTTIAPLIFVFDALFGGIALVGFGISLREDR